MSNTDAAESSKQLSPPRCRVAHAWVTDEVYEQLELAGQRERKHPDQIVAELVTKVYSLTGGG